MANKFEVLARRSEEACRRLLEELADADRIGDPEAKKENRLRSRLTALNQDVRRLIKLHGLVGESGRSMRRRLVEGRRRRTEALAREGKTVVWDD